MMQNQLLDYERRPPPLALHVLPAHQEVVAPLPTGYVGPVMQAGETWLRRFGYRPLGPWLISWGLNGQPQLRRPVSGAMRIGQEETFSAVEMPSLLMLAVPFRGWPILPRDLIPVVRGQELEPIGQPLLLALGNDPPTIAWVPVTPRGTLSLVQSVTATGTARKIGMLMPPPEPGALLDGMEILRFAWSATLRAFVTIILLSIFLSGMGALLPLLLSSEEVISFLIKALLILMAIIFAINLFSYWRSASAWNKFWARRKVPPVLALHGGLNTPEGDVPAWLGGQAG